MCVYLCGGSCIEDVTTHLMKHLSLHPTLRTCSADTILRAIEELTFKNITYKSASGKSYDFNTADKMNCLLIKALFATGQLKSGQEYDFLTLTISSLKQRSMMQNQPTRSSWAIVQVCATLTT